MPSNATYDPTWWTPATHTPTETHAHTHESHEIPSSPTVKADGFIQHDHDDVELDGSVDDERHMLTSNIHSTPDIRAINMPLRYRNRSGSLPTLNLSVCPCCQQQIDIGIPFHSHVTSCYMKHYPIEKKDSKKSRRKRNASPYHPYTSSTDAIASVKQQLSQLDINQRINLMETFRTLAAQIEQNPQQSPSPLMNFNEKLHDVLNLLYSPPVHARSGASPSTLKLDHHTVTMTPITLPSIPTVSASMAFDMAGDNDILLDDMNTSYHSSSSSCDYSSLSERSLSLPTSPDNYSDMPSILPVSSPVSTLEPESPCPTRTHHNRHISATNLFQTFPVFHNEPYNGCIQKQEADETVFQHLNVESL